MHPSVRPSVYLSIYLSIFHPSIHLFKYLFHSSIFFAPLPFHRTKSRCFSFRSPIQLQIVSNNFSEFTLHAIFATVTPLTTPEIAAAVIALQQWSFLLIVIHRFPQDTDACPSNKLYCRRHICWKGAAHSWQSVTSERGRQSTTSTLLNLTLQDAVRMGEKLNACLLYSFKYELYLSDLKTNFVPRSKHSLLRF